MKIDCKNLKTGDYFTTVGQSISSIDTTKEIMYKTILFPEVVNKKYLIEAQGYGLFGIYNTKEQAEERAKMIIKNNISCYVTEIESVEE